MCLEDMKMDNGNEDDGVAKRYFALHFPLYALFLDMPFAYDVMLCTT